MDIRLGLSLGIVNWPDMVNTESQSDLGGAPLLAPGLVPGCAGHEGLALVDEGEHAGHRLHLARVPLLGHRAFLGGGKLGQSQEAGH